MTRKVWCVFQRLPGESCPALSAVCASREVAEEVVRLSEADDRAQGRPESAWTIGAWGVLDGDLGEIANVQQISDVLDPMRTGALPPEETGDAPTAEPERGEERDA